MDRGAWWATVHGVAKSLNDNTFTFPLPCTTHCTEYHKIHLGYCEAREHGQQCLQCEGVKLVTLPSVLTRGSELGEAMTPQWFRSPVC